MTTKDKQRRTGKKNGESRSGKGAAAADGAREQHTRAARPLLGKVRARTRDGVAVATNGPVTVGTIDNRRGASDEKLRQLVEQVREQTALTQAPAAASPAPHATGTGQKPAPRREYEMPPVPVLVGLLVGGLALVAAAAVAAAVWPAVGGVLEVAFGGLGTLLAVPSSALLLHGWWTEGRDR